MNSLAADLQEATSDLLDLPNTSKNHSLGSRSKGKGQGLKVWSTTSQLELIRADDEDAQKSHGNQKDYARPLVETSGSAPALQVTTPPADSDNGDEDLQGSAATLKYSDRFGSLSSRTAPIRPPSANRRSEQITPSSSSSTLFPEQQSKSTLGLKTSGSNADIKSKNIWLNEKGERVLDGDVIGRLSLAHESANPESNEHDLRAQDGHPRSGQHTPKANRLSRDFDHTAHGASMRLHTPDFFLRSFPSKEKVAVVDSEATPSPLGGELLNSHDDEAVAKIDRTDDRRPPITRRISPASILGTSSIAGPILDEAVSEPVKLHGNRKAAQAAGDDVPEESILTHSNTASSYATPRGGIAWHTHRIGSGSRPRASPRTSFNNRPLLDRASSLFTTPLVPPMAERENPDDEDAGQWEDEDVQDRVDDVSANGDERDEGDNSSLLSLQASSITASNSDGASFSRRSSLRRANSTGSTSSTTSSRSRRGVESRGEVYARDVRVRGWSEVGTKTRGYVSFEVVVLTKRGVVIRAHRRYSSFVSLRRQLAADIPQHRSALPKLPPKDALHKYSARHLEQRRLGLTEWLQLVVLDPRWGPRTRDWLVGPG